MKKLLIWLLWIICLWFINFSSAWSVIYSWSYWTLFASTSMTNRGLLKLSIPAFNNISNISSSDYVTVSCSFSNLSSTGNSSIFNILDNANIYVRSYYMAFIQNNNNLSFSYVKTIDDPSSWIIIKNFFNWFTISFLLSELRFINPNYTPVLYLEFAPTSSISGFTWCSSSNTCSFTFDYSCTYTSDFISWSSDCSTIENQLTSCQSDLATATWNIVTLTNSLNTCQSDLQSCQNDSSCTQLKCENEYNLIPESSVTSAYCEETFNLIDPETCPSSWWTWDINWSNFFVNSHQINGASNIYLWLPEFLTWDYTYIDSWSTLEIDVENEWNPEYIEDILTVQTYHPSSEDFTQSFTWTLVLLMPYIIITLFIIFVWRLIKRIFK